MVLVQDRSKSIAVAVTDIVNIKRNKNYGAMVDRLQIVEAHFPLKVSSTHRRRF